MTTSRLTLALESGEVDPLEGTLSILNASGDLNVDGLTEARPNCSQHLFPEYKALQTRGLQVTPLPEAAESTHTLVLCLRSKAATLNLIASALEHTAPGGTVFVDGAKTDGIESILKELRRMFPEVHSYSKAHGKLIWLTRPADLPDLEAWQNVTYLYPNGWVTHAASFSSDGPDAGSQLLAQTMPALNGRIADLGAGWGYLSGEILKSEAVTELRGYEADYHAVQCAQNNVQDQRAQFDWADVLQLQEGAFDAVVTNPPFHTGRAAEPALGIGFISAAARILKPKGQLWLVANRGLPYEQPLEEAFRHVKTHAETGGFKIIQASQPKKARTGR